MGVGLYTTLHARSQRLRQSEIGGTTLDILATTDLAAAVSLVELAERRGLVLASAPCGVLGEAAQTAWKLLRDGALGKVRLVYAELDEGPIHLTNFRDWRSDSGAPWPYQDEFETGVTLEHAGYYITWLATFFGPARRVTAFAASIVPDKGVAVRRVAPDLSIGCIEFASGPVARLTCSLFAPHDHDLRIFGDAGTLDVEDCWDYASRVRLHRRTPLGLKAEKHPTLARLVGLGPRPVRLVRKPPFRLRGRGANQMDFARGIAEVADALREGRACRLSARFVLHVNEIVLAIQDPVAMGSPRLLATTFEPMAPMPWAGQGQGPRDG